MQCNLSNKWDVGARTSNKWHGPNKNITFCLVQIDSNTKQKQTNASMEIRKALSEKNTDKKVVKQWKK